MLLSDADRNQASAASHAAAVTALEQARETASLNHAEEVEMLNTASAAAAQVAADAANRYHPSWTSHAPPNLWQTAPPPPSLVTTVRTPLPSPATHRVGSGRNGGGLVDARCVPSAFQTPTLRKMENRH